MSVCVCVCVCVRGFLFAIYNSFCRCVYISMRQCMHTRYKLACIIHDVHVYTESVTQAAPLRNCNKCEEGAFLYPDISPVKKKQVGSTRGSEV
jgi:hypothetical protein